MPRPTRPVRPSVICRAVRRMARTLPRRPDARPPPGAADGRGRIDRMPVATRRRSPRPRPGRPLLRFAGSLGARFVAGADEAGRGSLAGPLVTAAVLLDHERLR